MDGIDDIVLKEKVIISALIEVKLFVNRNLFQQGAITEEMFTKAKELILKGE